MRATRVRSSSCSRSAIRGYGFRGRKFFGPARPAASVAQGSTDSIVSNIQSREILLPMIEIRNLTKRYGDFTAVDDISLDVARGEIFGFLGPNGAGKTTTIRILAGLSLPTSGTVFINDLDVTTESVRVKASTGYIPDRPFLYEKLTGRELLQFVTNLYDREWRDCESRAMELLAYFGIADWADA